MELFTAKELAPILSLTVQGVHFIAKNENWQPIPRKGRGGGYVWPFSSMPPATQAKILKAQSAHTAAAAAREDVLKALPGDAPKQTSLADLLSLSQSLQRRAEVRAALVMACRAYVKLNALPRMRGYKIFADEYSKLSIPVDKWIREALPTVSPNSIYNWDCLLQTKGIAALAGVYGKQVKKRPHPESEVKKFITAMLVEYPEVSSTNVMRGLKSRFAKDALPTKRTIQRYMAEWKEKNQSAYLKIINPDRWRNKFMSAAGRADAQVFALNQLWEMDSTPVDLILNNGQRYAIIGLIDVYSRRMIMHVVRTSTAAGVCATLRRGLLEWGVFKTLKIDNGAEYIGRQLTSFVQGLDLELDPCPPFSPEKKPHIERGFKTFLHGLLELMPGFIGHNVAERKDIEARISFARRINGEKESINLNMSPEDLQEFCDNWCQNVYQHDVHEGLGGLTPFDVAAGWQDPVRVIADERALDIFLMPPAGSGRNGDIRQVGKKGLRINGLYYNAPELGGLEGQNVRVRLDDGDIGYVYVFDEDMHFICRAEDPEVTGVSLYDLATARKRKQREAVNAATKKMRKVAREVGVKAIALEILANAKKENAEKNSAQAGALKQSTPHVAHGLTEAGYAAASANMPTSRKLTEKEQDILNAITRDYNLPPEVPEPHLYEAHAAKARYTKFLELSAKVEKGEKVSANDVIWLRGYPTTSEYRTQRRMAESFANLPAATSLAK